MQVEQENHITGSNHNPQQSGALDIIPADDGYIIYQPDQDKVHFLNATAVLILELCDGKHSKEELVELVKEAYGLPEPPVAIVEDALALMRAGGLVVDAQD